MYAYKDLQGRGTTQPACEASPGPEVTLGDHDGRQRCRVGSFLFLRRPRIRSGCRGRASWGPQERMALPRRRGAMTPRASGGVGQ